MRFGREKCLAAGYIVVLPESAAWKWRSARTERRIAGIGSRVVRQWKWYCRCFNHAVQCNDDDAAAEVMRDSGARVCIATSTSNAVSDVAHQDSAFSPLLLSQSVPPLTREAKQQQESSIRRNNHSNRRSSPLTPPPLCPL